MAHRIINRNNKGEEKKGLSAAVAGIDTGNDSSASVKTEVPAVSLPEEELPEVVVSNEEETKEVEVSEVPISMPSRKRGRKPKRVSTVSELTNICVDVNVFDIYVASREKYKRMTRNRGLTNSEFVSFLVKVFKSLSNEQINKLTNQ